MITLTLNEVKSRCINGSLVGKALHFYDTYMETSHYQTLSPYHDIAGEPLHNLTLEMIGGENVKC